MQGLGPTLSVEPAYPSHRIGATAQILGNRGLRPAHGGHQNNRTVAKDIGRGRAHSQTIQLGDGSVSLDSCQSDLRLERCTELVSFVLHNSSPESRIDPGDESTLTPGPVFGEYYNFGRGRNQSLRMS